MKRMLYRYGFIWYTILAAEDGVAASRKFAPVAQLDRVSDSDSEGRWFESSRAYQNPPHICEVGFVYDFLH